VDVQNTPPVFLSSLTGVVSEDAEIDTVVLTAQARDGDRGDPRRIVYELVTSKYIHSKFERIFTLNLKVNPEFESINFYPLCSTSRPSAKQKEPSGSQAVAQRGRRLIALPNLT